MAISKELQELYSGNKNDEVLIEAIEISHSMLPEVYRFCNFYDDINVKIEDGTTMLFKKSNFISTHPNFQNSGLLEFSFTFSLVDFKYLKIINSVMNKSTELIKLKYRMYTDKNMNYPLLEAPLEIMISDIGTTNMQLVFKGQHLQNLQKKCPVMTFNPNVFIGLL